MKLRSNLIGIVVFVIGLAMFAAAMKLGHHGGGYLKGFSNGG